MSYKIKEIPLTERPRERLKLIGKENLSDKELLAIILKTGTKERNVTELALDILNNYPLSKIEDVNLNQLIKIKGVGEVKAIELLACIEIGKRIYIKKSQTLTELKNAQEIYLATRYLFINKKQEYFYALYFNNKRQLLETKLLFMGTVNESIVHPREVFKEAYCVSASYIVCIHNHPSNDTTPSNADILFTNKIMETGIIHGIKVVDHIISGHNNFYSFYEKEKIFIKEEL